MEPILIEIGPNGQSPTEDPHEGEEFGYVLSGKIILNIGDSKYKAKKGDSFYFKPTAIHHIKNNSRSTAKMIWISSPPNF